ncbi:COX15/CtaA family protein [Ponticoccus sp. SC2-23]|uniref:heme A synthase n=1 Tax=Alexandriicola marinus TaxID=2081710 RepID=UPI000FDA9263|nr:heme A synthase [Alexandriicola marinus]MBM1218785.1 COX15/CtaA family protein [Ponticoccus sp. SC6-9]MBM1224143.1 COX15/CtaA family protein [Ponticoccus sp. SC6-15]MBM1230078.1 COX15/CtaA family protein [Ponticoccus sp. SC6-38]MBM1233109.1 COX15/CtaA family protein [Ponticoccus sp. SC6-45]MBM1236941.1 COX15/CtaA family protein [Ponticoccus sp. SC6-49]MBM1242120.1 COX15/CtaA family protein [Ponticoccus sp. SC2-64]MBM1246633.1 COX15/CtaA family protein [Ponticoccus sp. SC6-42]MBM1251111.1
MGMKPKQGSNRSIFEEVATTQKAPVAQPGAIDRGRKDARGAIRVWLMILFALVAIIIAVGGMTRLTDSGLSITEWAPISGALPPMSEADWQSELEAYRQTTEYQRQNAGMSMAEFKYIYWWEWGHRQLGRLIGVVWAVGFVAFWASGRIPRSWTLPLFSVGVLIGVQGAIGWWMVHSGLQEGMFDVASYRLATHLGVAFVILGTLTWFILKMGRKETDLIQARRLGEKRLFSGATGLMHLAFVQILLGALVAGIDAGRAFPTWPLMGDGFLPPEPFQITPIWRNFFEDAGLVQFIHRMTGYLVFILGIVVWLRARKSPNGQTRFAFNAVLAVLTLQVLLGIVTVLYSAPLHLAILHQVGAVILWALILRGRFLARYPLAQSVRG